MLFICTHRVGLIAADATSLRTTLTPRNSSLVPIAENLVDKVWTSRPPRPANPIHPLPLEYAGASASEKLGILRAKLARAGATGVVVCLLDEVAWLVGMRGADIAYNPGWFIWMMIFIVKLIHVLEIPVFFAYAVVTPNRASLFINSSQLTPEAQASLKEAGWETEKYEDTITRLKELGSEVKDQVDEEKEAEDEDGDEAQTTKGEAQGVSQLYYFKFPHY